MYVAMSDEDEAPGPASGATGYLLGGGIPQARRIAIKVRAGEVSTRGFGEEWQTIGIIDK